MSEFQSHLAMGVGMICASLSGMYVTGYPAFWGGVVLGTAWTFYALRKPKER
jgi:hypothetical protein